MNLRLSNSFPSVLKRKGGLIFFCKVETCKLQSTIEKTKEDQPSSVLDQKQTTGKTAAREIVQTKIADSNVNEEKLEEIPLKEMGNESAKSKTEVAKDSKETKEGKIDPSSKTRKSARSPLLEKLLSPGRRSKRGQKDKTKSAEVETTRHSEDIAETSPSKADDKSAKIHSEKLSDSSKVKTEGKVEKTTKSKGKSDEGQKKLEQTEKVKSDEKANASHLENEPLSAITGTFDVFKFGGKKSK